MKKYFNKFCISLVVLFLIFPIKSYGKELEKRVLTEYLEFYGEEIAVEYDLNWNLVKAVLFLESRYDINCVTHNYDKKGNVVSTDSGIGQQNDQWLAWYGELAGIENPDPFNPIHSIKMLCAGLNFWKEYGIREGYEGEELTLIMINSYNTGFNGYMQHIEKHGTMDRAYSNVVLGFKVMIDEYGYILD